jgi:UDP-2-acetamido-3-amino-2,3-dideoxy-glucuronate N-acetyltransferase
MIPLTDPDLLTFPKNALPPLFIHPQAVVETSKVGPGTRVWAFAHLASGCVVGSECNICDHTFIEKGVRVGDRVTLKSGVYLWTGTVIEDDVFIGPAVTFTNDRRPRSRRPPESFDGVTVRRGASIGAGAILLPGVEIGEYAMIGAGSVVTHSVPAHALVYGNPARKRGEVCRCGQTLGRYELPPLCGACIEQQGRRGQAA